MRVKGKIMKLNHLFMTLIIICVSSFLLSHISVLASEPQNLIDCECLGINFSLNENEVIESLINLRSKYKNIYDSEGALCHEETNSKIKIINDYIAIKAKQGVSSACNDYKLHYEEVDRNGVCFQSQIIDTKSYESLLKKL